MFTVLDSLIGVTGYPIPQRTLMTVSAKRGLDAEADATKETLNSRAFRLCEADLLMWLYRAPNVSQGGQSYNFTDAQREDFRKRAQKIYDAIGDEDDKQGSGIRYGYKGSRL